MMWKPLSYDLNEQIMLFLDQKVHIFLCEIHILQHKLENRANHRGRRFFEVSSLS